MTGHGTPETVCQGTEFGERWTDVGVLPEGLGCLVRPNTAHEDPVSRGEKDDTEQIISIQRSGRLTREVLLFRGQGRVSDRVSTMGYV